MGRPREFDEHEVVERAMNTFWARGYKSANLPDLLEATQITRGSFYKAFGSKREVFLKAFDLYVETEFDSLISMLVSSEEEPDGLVRLRRVFNCADQRSIRGDRRGCLIYNSMTELGDSDEEISERFNDSLSQVSAAFENAIADAVTHNQPMTAKEISCWSDNVVAAFFGFKMYNRAGLNYDLYACLKLLAKRLGRENEKVT